MNINNFLLNKILYSFQIFLQDKFDFIKYYLYKKIILKFYH